MFTSSSVGIHLPAVAMLDWVFRKHKDPIASKLTNRENSTMKMTIWSSS